MNNRKENIKAIVIAIFIAIVTVSFLLACLAWAIDPLVRIGSDESYFESTAYDENVLSTVNTDCFSVWTDPDTGVQYIVYPKTGNGKHRPNVTYSGITLRLNADGSVCVVDGRDSNEKRSD